MKIKKANLYCMIIGSIWFLYERGYYLLPDSLGPVLTTDVANLLLLFFDILVLFKYGLLKPKIWDSFHWLSFGLIFLTFISAITAKLHWMQSFMATIYPQRYLIIIALSYFAVKELLRSRIITGEEIFSMIINLGRLYTIIMMVQFVLSFSGITFLQCTITNVTSLPRYFIDGTILIILLFYEVQRIFSEKFRFSSLIWGICTIIFFMLMCQTRMILVGLLITFGIFALIFSTTAWKKIGILIIFCTVLAFVWNTTLFQDTINITTASHNTLEIRQQGILYYLSELVKSPLFGFGYPNSDLADISRGKFLGYLLNDNGIFGFMYMYGGLGLFWAAWRYITSIKKGIRIKKCLNKYTYMMYSIYTIVISASLIHWYWQRSTCFLMILMWIVIQEEITNLKEERNA